MAPSNVDSIYLRFTSLGLSELVAGDVKADDLINGNHGVLHNGATFATGIVGQAFVFNGLDDFVEAPTIGLHK